MVAGKVVAGRVVVAGKVVAGRVVVAGKVVAGRVVVAGKVVAGRVVVVMVLIVALPFALLIDLEITPNQIPTNIAARITNVSKTIIIMNLGLFVKYKFLKLDKNE